MKKPLRSIVDYLLLTIIVSLAVVAILFFNGNNFYPANHYCRFIYTIYSMGYPTPSKREESTGTNSPRIRAFCPPWMYNSYRFTEIVANYQLYNCKI